MNPECQNCPLHEQMDQLREEVKRLQDKYSDSRKEIFKRLGDLENERGRTEEQYKQIKDDIGKLFDQYDTILKRLDELRQQPAKRWDSMVSSGISAIVGALIGYLGTKIGG